MVHHLANRERELVKARLPRLTRQCVLVFGAALSLSVGIVNLRGDLNAPDVSWSELAIIFGVGWLWNTWPFLGYFFLARRVDSLVLALIPGVVMCVVQASGVARYFLWSVSTSGIAFFFLSIIEAVCGVLAFFAAVFVLAALDKIRDRGPGVL